MMIIPDSEVEIVIGGRGSLSHTVEVPKEMKDDLRKFLLAQYNKYRDNYIEDAKESIKEIKIVGE